MSTPMRQQYLALKRQYPDCILLFRLGDFYETFDEDAKTVARVCDVVLTSRPVGNDQRVPLAGVPYHSVDGYIVRLVEAGYRVAIAEQVSEPGRGLVEREVRRVVTKGTVTEPALLDERRNNYLTAVTFGSQGGNQGGNWGGSRGHAAGLAYCDITTGEFAQSAVDFANTRPIELYGKNSVRVTRHRTAGPYSDRSGGETFLGGAPSGRYGGSGAWRVVKIWRLLRVLHRR
jgi:DNA mismatch repair protein MutS